MRTDVRYLPARVAAVSVGVLWGRKHRDNQPELMPVTEVGVVVVERQSDRLQIESRELLEGSDIALTADHLSDLGLPVVGFNLLRFDWIALQSRCDVAPLIEQTIDIYSSLYPLVREIVDAEGVSAFPRSGEYGVLNSRRLCELNLGYVPGGGDALAEAELAADLWHQLALTERALVAGRTHVIEGEPLDLLTGVRPAFTTVADWQSEIRKRPEPEPYRRRTRHQVTFPRIDQRYV